MFKCENCQGEIGHAPYCKGKTQRKHAELIKAWADGAKIQVLRSDGTWHDVFQNSPAWYDTSVYRIKPEPKPDLIVNAMVEFKNAWKAPRVFTSWNGLEISNGNKHVQWMEHLKHIRFTFDGENPDILKSVEVIHGKEV